MKQVGHNTISVLTAAVGLGQGLASNAIPARARYATIQALAQNVRWWDDGTVPTASTGMRLAAGSSMTYSLGPLANLKFIEETPSASLVVTFYG